MSQATLANMLTIIRNAQAVKKMQVSVPASKVKEAVCRILKQEGYIVDYRTEEEGAKKRLIIDLKYYQGQPVISTIKLVSKGSRRVYKAYKELPIVLNGLGIAIVSTSQGIMTSQSAHKAGIGGEILCEVI